MMILRAPRSGKVFTRSYSPVDIVTSRLRPPPLKAEVRDDEHEGRAGRRGARALGRERRRPLSEGFAQLGLPARRGRPTTLLPPRRPAPIRARQGPGVCPGRDPAAQGAGIFAFSVGKERLTGGAAERC